MRDTHKKKRQWRECCTTQLERESRDRLGASDAVHRVQSLRPSSRKLLSKTAPAPRLPCDDAMARPPDSDAAAWRATFPEAPPDLLADAGWSLERVNQLGESGILGQVGTRGAHTFHCALPGAAGRGGPQPPPLHKKKGQPFFVSAVARCVVPARASPRPRCRRADTRTRVIMCTVCGPWGRGGLVGANRHARARGRRVALFDPNEKACENRAVHTLPAPTRLRTRLDRPRRTRGQSVCDSGGRVAG